MFSTMWINLGVRVPDEISQTQKIVSDSIGKTKPYSTDSGAKIVLDWAGRKGLTTKGPRANICDNSEKYLDYSFGYRTTRIC